MHAVRKNISLVCLVFIINTVCKRLIRLSLEILPLSFTKKDFKFVIKRDPKNFLEVAKEIERLQQNALVKLRFSYSDS